MPIVELQSVSYRYLDAPKRALDDVTLTIAEGEYVLLAGASGSGKSSLCRLLNGLIPHFYEGWLEGHVHVDGLDTRKHPVRELFSHVGLVFQNPAAQLFNSTVARDVAFGLESLGLDKATIHARTKSALASTGITHLASRAPHTLSGGEQQRVATAAILALEPRILVLDEPFSSLDPEGLSSLRKLLMQIRAHGTTVIVAEHRLGASLADATRLVILDHGTMVRDGEPRQVLRGDVTQFNLNMPFVVRLAHESGWKEIPLSVDEAVALARAHDHVHVPNGQPKPYRQLQDSAPVVEMRSAYFDLQGDKVLRGVDLTVRRGECLALVGKNGSGKTSLLKHINGIYRPTRGTVTVLGRDTRRTPVSEVAQQVGSVFQNPNSQLFKPNVREEIEVGPKALKRFDREWMDHLIAWFGLIPFLDRSPFALSEGEKKRVTFASALATRPDIVLLDEPTTGQDLAFRTALERLLKELEQEGITVILATHDLEFAEQVSSRWLVLADGEIIADANPDQVMGNEAVLTRAALRPTARFKLEEELASPGSLSQRPVEEGRNG